MEEEIEVVTGIIADKVIPLIRSAKRRIWVVSPWISPEIAQLLIQRHMEGVDTKLITTLNVSPSHIQALYQLLERREELVKPPRRGLLIAGFIIILLGLLTSIILSVSLEIMLIVYVLPTFLVVMIVGLVLLALGMGVKRSYLASRIGEENLVIFSDEQSLHAKLLICDDTAVIGSANMTWSGLYRNIEIIIIIKTPQLVRRLENFFEKLLSKQQEADIQKTLQQILVYWRVLPRYRRERMKTLSI